MIVQPNTYFDVKYDVVVLGFGGAGATAARFAADSGAKVLLVDSAPEGHEGGNTRYSGQVVSSGDSYHDLYHYYQQLMAPLHVDPELFKTYISGMYHIPEYMRKYLEAKPFIFNHHPNNPLVKGLASMTREYPEFSGSKTHELVTVHPGGIDGALWKTLRKQVIDRNNKIDIWYSSPAKHLFQTTDKKVIGVQVERKHVLRNIKAQNGVVLATGGFENNPSKLENYLGQNNLAPLGTLYNKGIGIDLSLEVGAQTWNMHAYEANGLFHGLTTLPKAGRSFFFSSDYPKIHQGSIIVVGEDGSRYFNENEHQRHGHIYQHGYWKVPQMPKKVYTIFDQKKYKQLKNDQKTPYPNLLENLVSADSLVSLAKKIDVDQKGLAKTIADFNFFTKQGIDYAYNRSVTSMSKFTGNKLYALPLTEGLLNTQGGPQHNSRAEVLDPFGKSIPHLYAAGELGGISVNQYNGGGNLAECLIFGKIAGQNAAHPKSDQSVNQNTTNKTTDTQTSASETKTNSALASDNKKENYQTGKNQYIGRSTSGMGDEIIVKITVGIGNSLKSVEVLKESESKDYGLKAIQKLPDKMVKQNTYKVDSISGATVSSRGLKDAVKDALDKIPTVQKD